MKYTADYGNCTHKICANTYVSGPLKSFSKFFPIPDITRINIMCLLILEGKNVVNCQVGQDKLQFRQPGSFSIVYFSIQNRPFYGFGYCISLTKSLQNFGIVCPSTPSLF